MQVKPAFADHFSGSTAVVTGAASGIGRSLAGLLSASGAKVHALDLDAAGLATLVSENPGPGTIHTELLDVRDREAYQKVVEAVLAESPVIDFLFNNAGVTQLGEAHQVPFERWKWLLDINLMGVVNGTLLVYPLMIRQGYGHIVNTASVAGATGYATASAYTASKAAVLEFSRSLRAEARDYGVKVSVACPGYVNSSIFTQDRVLGADCGEMIQDLPVRMMTPAQAATGFLDGVVAGKKTIVFPFSAKVLWQMASWAPPLMAPFQKRFLRTFRRG